MGTKQQADPEEGLHLKAMVLLKEQEVMRLLMRLLIMAPMLLSTNQATEQKVEQQEMVMELLVATQPGITMVLLAQEAEEEEEIKEAVVEEREEGDQLGTTTELQDQVLGILMEHRMDKLATEVDLLPEMDTEPQEGINQSMETGACQATVTREDISLGEEISLNTFTLEIDGLGCFYH